MGKIPAIDMARCLAVLMVLCGHLGLNLHPQTPAAPWGWIWYKTWVNGSYGVPLFFVVSGFLITRLLAQGPGGLFQADWVWFYARRAGRILPLLVWVCVIGLVLTLAPPLPPAAALAFMGPPSQLAHWDFWVSIATFWFNWFLLFHPVAGFQWMVLWSLSVEEQFYFFYPLALRLLGNRRNLVIFLALFVFLGPASQWAGSAWGIKHPMAHYNSFSGFGLIALGGLLYLALEKFQPYLSANPRRCRWLAISGLAVMAKVYFHQPYLADYWGSRLDDFWIGLGLAFFLLGTLPLEAFQSRVWEPLRRVGQLSYGVYLYQACVICVLYPWIKDLNPFGSFFAGLAAIGTVAWLSFRYFETPANQFLRRKLGGTA